MINAGKYSKRITIKKVVYSEDAEAFPIQTETDVLTAYASVRTIRGYTLITSNTDFSKAFTNFTIRYPKVEITRDMLIYYNGRKYTIEYINNIDEANIELELQAKEVSK